MRPVSGKSNNSRYTAATKAANNRHATIQPDGEDAASLQDFRKTHKTSGVETPLGDKAGNTSKLAYYTDEDEDELDDGVTAKNPGSALHTGLKAERLVSGRTQMTVQNKKTRIHIADDNDDVNL